MLRAVLFFCILLVSTTAFGEVSRVGIVTIDGAITPVVSDYLRRSILVSEQAGEAFLLVQMDTPGGLDSAMRDSIKSILASPVPVVVFVGPSGARAASAGAVMAMAADVCAMAPGTNIGAAHPVSQGGKPDTVMAEKILNDAEAYAEGIARKRGRNTDAARRMVRESVSFSADTARNEKIVDLLATDRAELLVRLDGWRLNRGGKMVTLRTAGAATVAHEMTTREQVLQVLSNPDVAYILMMVGLLGLFLEFSTPGVIVPGVVGAISLILSAFALQTLPVNYAGVLLIVLAVVLFVVETQVISHGVLAIGGIISLLLGSLMLFPSPEPQLRISYGILFGTVAVTGALFLWIISRAVAVHRRTPTTGAEGLVGEQGFADTDVGPDGKVSVHGEYWDAWSDEPIRRGERVRVIGVEGLRLKVSKVTGDQ